MRALYGKQEGNAFPGGFLVPYSTLALARAKCASSIDIVVPVVVAVGGIDVVEYTSHLHKHSKCGAVARLVVERFEGLVLEPLAVRFGRAVGQRRRRDDR